MLMYCDPWPGNMRQVFLFFILSLSPTNIPLAARAIRAFSFMPTFFNMAICSAKWAPSFATIASLYLPFPSGLSQMSLSLTADLAFSDASSARFSIFMGSSESKKNTSDARSPFLAMYSETFSISYSIGASGLDDASWTLLGDASLALFHAEWIIGSNSSMTTWKLVPPNPNEDTPHLLGVSGAILFHSMGFVIT